MARKDTKTEILAVARRLFSERGYNDVTMRDIAQAAGMSVGNLTYHYKRKDILMEAAVVEDRQNYKMPITPTTLEDLNKVFTYMANYNLDNAYYFRHYTQISQISPRVHQIQMDTVRDLVYVFTSSFAELQKKDLMLAETFPGQARYLAFSIMNTTSFWLYQREIIAEAKSNPIYEILSCLWSMVTPMLTAKGRDVFQHRILTVNSRLK